MHEFENQLKNADADKYNLLQKKAESAIASLLEAHQPTDGLSIGNTDSRLHVPQPGEQMYVNGLGEKVGYCN